MGFLFLPLQKCVCEEMRELKVTLAMLTAPVYKEKINTLAIKDYLISCEYIF